jgi:hypothetical protein
MNFIMQNGSFLKKSEIKLLAEYLESSEWEQFDVVISRNTYSDELEVELVPANWASEDA